VRGTEPASFGMPTDWAAYTDAELAEKSSQGMAGSGAAIEAMRRLRESNDALGKRVVSLTGTLVGLTRWLLLLTFALLVVAVATIVILLMPHHDGS
jgi:hypothetical protein